MKINPKLRFQLFMQNSFFVLLFLALVALLGYASRDYYVARDITQSNRNTLTEGSLNVLKQMPAPINITVFASNDDEYRRKIHAFLARYQRSKLDINVTYVNPAEQPKLAQEAGIKSEGELVVEYQKRSENLAPPYVEQDMTNLLVRLSRSNQRAVMYLEGHGERNMIGVKSHDLGEFGRNLEKKGFKLANPDLTKLPAVPTDGAMLVIAGPQVDVSAVEVQKIITYLEAGGNLLWLLEDDNLRGLQPVADFLGLTVYPGTVVDMSAAQQGADVKVAFNGLYGEHAITKNFMLRTLFPEARKIEARGTFENGWEVSQLVEVAGNGWLEKGSLDKVNFDDKTDEAGPINIAVALERVYGKKGQRAVIIGNANFLSNTFVTNGGNMDFGINMVNWLAGDDNFITIQPRPLKDVNVAIPPGSLAAPVIFLGFRYALPILLLVAGVWLWWRRRKA
ncbi:GldG family protein [Methylobacillus flagellatus]|uniref:GldG family protein n=1 Tax=Methylobacillus flagellatus TaxID=405 RepID=UPI0010F77CD4|nr:GldG family protein [Methylobacillus flagellatus]